MPVKNFDYQEIADDKLINCFSMSGHAEIITHLKSLCLPHGMQQYFEPGFVDMTNVIARKLLTALLRTFIVEMKVYHTH